MNKERLRQRGRGDGKKDKCWITGSMDVSLWELQESWTGEQRAAWGRKGRIALLVLNWTGNNGSPRHKLRVYSNWILRKTIKNTLIIGLKREVANVGRCITMWYCHVAQVAVFTSACLQFHVEETDGYFWLTLNMNRVYMPAFASWLAISKYVMELEFTFNTL